MTTFEYRISETYDFDYPEWSTVGHGHFWGGKEKVYSCFDGETLVAYAGVDEISSHPAQTIEISCQETNPNYRRQGHGRKLVEMVRNDYSQSNIFLNPINETEVVSFWAAMGFQFLWMNGGTETYTLMWINPQSGFSMADEVDWIENDPWFCELDVCDLSHAGAVWNSSEQRFFMERSYPQELIAVRNDSYEIAYVKEQTRELQLIVVQDDCFPLASVKSVHPDVRAIAIRRYTYDCPFNNYTDEEIAIMEEEENRLRQKKNNMILRNMRNISQNAQSLRKEEMIDKDSFVRDVKGMLKCVATLIGKDAKVKGAMTIYTYILSHSPRFFQEHGPYSNLFTTIDLKLLELHGAMPSAGFDSVRKIFLQRMRNYITENKQTLSLSGWNEYSAVAV